MTPTEWQRIADREGAWPRRSRIQSYVASLVFLNSQSRRERVERIKQWVALTPRRTFFEGTP